MIDRSLRVQFRLTQKEHAMFAPLIREHRTGTWSSLVRLALKEFWERHPPTTSDNGVRHEEQTETPSLFARVKKKTSKRGALPRRGKSAVSH